MQEIKIAVIGIGNCASALVQGIALSRRVPPGEGIGEIHEWIGPYRCADIRVVAAFDIDERKVGQDVCRAILALPNCTTVFCPDVPETGVVVQMGKILDGFPGHMLEHDEAHRFVPGDGRQPELADVVAHLRDSGAEILVNFLPVGSEQATRFYAEAALEAGCGFVNGIPVFIASDPSWARRFAERRLPLIGDDVKSQVGATILHRTIADLFKKRGARLDRTYQLNVGGNTDFLNMLDRDRLRNKVTSKTEAVQSSVPSRLPAEDIHIGPSDYVPWQKDNKVCFIRLEGRLFGGVPMNIELRLSVEDSPNSAGVVTDAIRCCKVALDRGESGVLEIPSAALMKHPPVQYADDRVAQLLDDYLESLCTVATP
jgi:myo-inositol-1-phosphate synthase